MATQPSPLALRVARYLTRIGYRELAGVSRSQYYRAYSKTSASGQSDVIWVRTDGSVRTSPTLDKVRHPTLPLHSADEMFAIVELFEGGVGNKPTTATPSRSEKHRRIV